MSGIEKGQERKPEARRMPGYLRGALSTLTAAAIMSSAVVGMASTATAAPGDATTLELSNGKGLTVAVGDAFPQVVSYDLGGSVIAGQGQSLTTFLINGQAKVASTTVSVSGATATYSSTIADPAIVITSTITVTDQNTVEFRVTKISGGGSRNQYPLHSRAFPAVRKLF